MGKLEGKEVWDGTSGTVTTSTTSNHRDQLCPLSTNLVCPAAIFPIKIRHSNRSQFSLDSFKLYVMGPGILWQRRSRYIPLPFSSLEELDTDWHITLQFHVSSCLRLAVAAHVEEILREAGQPLSANEIAKFSSLNPDKLGSLFPYGSFRYRRLTNQVPIAQCLRLLASNHIFVEVEKGVFARNRLSAILDTGKSLDFIKAYVF